jgi:hypothetical protein
VIYPWPDPQGNAGEAGELGGVGGKVRPIKNIGLHVEQGVENAYEPKELKDPPVGLGGERPWRQKEGQTKGDPKEESEAPPHEPKGEDEGGPPHALHHATRGKGPEPGRLQKEDAPEDRPQITSRQGKEGLSTRAVTGAPQSGAEENGLYASSGGYCGQSMAHLVEKDHEELEGKDEG